MSKKTTRAAISAVILLTALIAVMYTTVSEGARFYKHVDEVMNEPAQWSARPRTSMASWWTSRSSSAGRRLPVQGSLRRLFGDGDVLGVVPDTFKDGAEVVLTGELGPDGFKASDITAKCPSKYEAAGPGAPVTR